MRSHPNPSPDRLSYARLVTVVSAVLAVPLVGGLLTNPQLLAVLATVTVIVALPAVLFSVARRTVVVLARLSDRDGDSAGRQERCKDGRCPPVAADHAD